MKDVRPQSPSLLARATHILVARLETVDDPPWAPRKQVGEERVIHARLTLEEVAKGSVTQAPGDAFELDAKQVRVGFSWTPMPGIWSNALTDPGTRLVVFSSTASQDAAVVFNDPAGIRLVPAEAVLTDVHLAAQIEGSQLDLSGAFAHAAKQAPDIGELLVDWLWDRYRAVAMADIGQFEIVAAFVEDPKLNVVARTGLLMTLSTAVDAPDPPATKHIDRLARAMFRLLGTPAAKDLHGNLIGTHLPNVIGIGGDRTRTADQVFDGHPAERAAAKQALSAYSGPEPTATLLQWISR